ncbi:MAG TPA: extracellular solute-binding protein [Chloroflexota bacterium]|nr:extracellular solute-binding protein [Chloroflexota bacterium]
MGPISPVRRRRMLGGALLPVGGVLAVACGRAGQSETPDAAERPASAPPADLRVWFHYGGKTGEATQALIDRYNGTRGAQDRIKVGIEVVSSNPAEYRAKMTSAQLAGSSPDVYHFGLAVSELAQNNFLAELPPDETAYVKGNFTPGAAERMTYKGKVWGYPTENSAAAVIYRKTYFKELGLQPPTSPQQVRDLARRLNRVEGDQASRLGFVFNWQNAVPFYFAEIIARFGGQMVTFEGGRPTKISVTTPAAVDAVTWHLSMVEDGTTLVGRQLGVGDAWVNGVAAMGEGEPWLPLNTIRARGFQEIYDDIGVVRLPTASGVAPVAFVNGWTLAGSKDSKQSDARWRFLRWMMRKPEMPFSRLVVEQVGALPAPTGYPTEIPNWSPDLVQGYVKDTLPITKAHPLLNVLGKGEIDALCATTFQNIMQKKQAPLEGLKALEPQLNDILKKYNP